MCTVQSEVPLLVYVLPPAAVLHLLLHRLSLAHVRTEEESDGVNKWLQLISATHFSVVKATSCTLNATSFQDWQHLNCLR